MSKFNFRNVNSVKLFTKLVIVAVALSWAAILYFVFTIDVITDWRIMLPGQTKAGDTSQVPDIHAGDQIVVQSLYTKLREVKGTSTRYIECESSKDVFVAYPINVATADRPAGQRTGTGAAIVIPRIIPNLPATCRIRITIIYPVLPFRDVPESAISDEFQLLPETTQSETVLQSEPRTTPSQDQVLYRSSSNNTPPQNPGVSNNSQESAELNLVDRIIKLLGGN